MGWVDQRLITINRHDMLNKPFRPRKDDFKVVIRLLGRENAYGQAVYEDNTIEIDPRQTDCEKLDTAIHESLHLLYPELSEKQVSRDARRISRMLYYRLGYHTTPPQAHIRE